ncbi:hypothetical protein FBEOM_7329 [Fusarium beomiforme]|uniref:Uncharacterized protein n=1 Tax=Fusarium beomiforme TaxID=44412 RepID=A0A9P5AHV4_9HYPO|nr:hypothetical protein FBEOM_7329 [Fusarium beomiforme]
MFTPSREVNQYLWRPQMAMAPNYNPEMCLEVFLQTPGLSFTNDVRDNIAFRQACTKVFSSSAPRPDMTTDQAEDTICEFFKECDNNLPSLTMCPNHPLFSPGPCTCPAPIYQYFETVGNVLSNRWLRPVLAKDARCITENALAARIKYIQEHGIMGVEDNLVLLNVQILLCTFGQFKHSTSYRPVHGLYWSVELAIAQQQEARSKIEEVLKQQERQKARPLMGGGHLSTAQLASPDEDMSETLIPCR